MKYKYSSRSAIFFYIRKNDDKSLLHGVAVGESRRYPPIAIFKPPRSYAWARRFTSVESAIRCAAEANITDVTIIDGSERVMCVIKADGEVCRCA